MNLAWKDKFFFQINGWCMQRMQQILSERNKKKIKNKLKKKIEKQKKKMNQTWQDKFFFIMGDA